MLRTDREEVIDPEVSLVSDSKGLYDALNNELPQDDKKSAVEMPIIEQMLKRMKGRSRWVPHNFNPADALTKLKGAHMAPMMDLLKTGFYHLRTEEAQLKQRATEKSELGHTQRFKQSGKVNKDSHASYYVGFVGISMRVYPVCTPYITSSVHIPVGARKDLGMSNTHRNTHVHGTSES